MPKAFLDKDPKIPWMDPEGEVRFQEGLREGKYGRPLTLWVDPEYQPSVDDPKIVDDICEIGTEALAWYISFHQSRSWGIYFRLRGLAFLAGLLMAKNPAIEASEGMKRAYDVVFQHELFHFLTDITAVHMEMVYQKPIYNDYLSYLVGDKVKDFKIEEPLANAYSLRHSQRRLYSGIKDLFSRQPLPYCRYRDFAEDADFLSGKRKLGAIVRIHDDTLIFPGLINNFPDTTEPRWEFLYNVTPEKLFLPEIPIRFVIEKNHPTSGMKFVTPVEYGAQVAAYPCRERGHLPHLHIWVPADSRIDGRYLYPSLQPYMGARPLTNRQRKKAERLIVKYKEKLEGDLVGFNAAG